MNWDTLHQAEIEAGLHDTANHSIRVKWVAALRDSVAHRCPLNNLGQPVVSDIDILVASLEERCAALEKILAIAKPKTGDNIQP